MANAEQSAEFNPNLATRMDHVDAWCDKWSDRLNPILVKETRQALKSRQFVVTFSFLLFAALGWTFIGTFSLMPKIYDTPSAPRMLIGYYFVLALPMLLVVPLAAYRSLEGEIDDGTLELLSITSLSPWQIVLGKLASAMLQMMLYFVALFPCVSYAYTLRGVDFPTTVVLMGVLLLSGVMLTITALFFSPISEKRTTRVVTLLAVLGILALAEFGLGALAVELILNGLDLSVEQILGLVGSAVLTCIGVGYLLLTVTAAQLTPVSENRSTKIRLALLLLNGIVISVVAFWVGRIEDDISASWFFVFFGGSLLMVVWTVAGSMLVSESPIVTPRVQRELPKSFLARAAFTWLTPGPETGLIFTVANILVVGILTAGALIEMSSAWSGSGSTIPRNAAVTATLPDLVSRFVFGYVSYLTCFLLLVYGLMRIIRIKNNPRVEVGIAALAVVAVFASVLPYGIGLYLSDFRSFQYSFLQLTNWAWTLFEVLDGNDLTASIMLVASVGLIGVIFILYANPHLVLPRRIATPKRVLEERGETGM